MSSCYLKNSKECINHSYTELRTTLNHSENVSCVSSRDNMISSCRNRSGFSQVCKLRGNFFYIEIFLSGYRRRYSAISNVELPLQKKKKHK
jgi:hypothetical protein